MDVSACKRIGTFLAFIKAPSRLHGEKIHSIAPVTVTNQKAHAPAPAPVGTPPVGELRSRIHFDENLTIPMTAAPRIWKTPVG